MVFTGEGYIGEVGVAGTSEVPCSFQNSVGSTCADTAGVGNLAAFRLADHEVAAFPLADEVAAFSLADEEVAAFPLADQDSDMAQVLGEGVAVRVVLCRVPPARVGVSLGRWWVALVRGRGSPVPMLWLGTSCLSFPCKRRERQYDCM